MKLRKATSKDFKEIAKIYSEEFSKPPYNEKWTESLALKKIKLFNKYADIYVATVNNQIVGFIIINPNQWCPGDVAFAEEFAVKSEYQKKGIGTSILKKIMQIYKKKGYNYLTGIANKKSDAFKLYKKLNILPSNNGIIVDKRLK